MLSSALNFFHRSVKLGCELFNFSQVLNVSNITLKDAYLWVER